MTHRCAVAVACALLLAGPSAAQSLASCDASVSFVDFGRVDFRRGGEITGEVVVRCPRPDRFSLALSEGLGDFGMRRMRGPGGAELRYNLYLDPARRQVWGDGVSGGTARLAGQSDGRRAAIFTVYGRVPPGQSAPPGAYGDALAITFEP